MQKMRSASEVEERDQVTSPKDSPETQDGNRGMSNKRRFLDPLCFTFSLFRIERSFVRTLRGRGRLNLCIRF